MNKFYLFLSLFLIFSNSKTQWEPKFEDEPAGLLTDEEIDEYAKKAALNIEKIKLEAQLNKDGQLDDEKCKMLSDEDFAKLMSTIILRKLDKLKLNSEKNKADSNNIAPANKNSDIKPESTKSINKKTSWFSKIKNFIWTQTSPEASSGTENNSQIDNKPAGTCILCEKVSRWCPVLGSYPVELSWIINDLKNNKVRRNRLLLYGNPGNGKTLIAQTIAELTGSEFHSVDTPSIVHFVGDGAVAIKNAFLNAWKLVEGSTEKKVIIFFDEINNLATHTDKQGRSEHLAALTELWYHLDKYKDTSRIFIICATNSLECFNAAFLDRFNYKIEIKDPDLNDRKDLLRHYANLYNATLSTEQINLIAENTEGASRRSLEGLVDYLERWAANDNNKIITDKMIESRLVDVKKDITNKLKSIENEKIENESKELQYRNLELQIQQHKYLNKTSLILNCCSLITVAYTFINWLAHKYQNTPKYS